MNMNTWYIKFIEYVVMKPQEMASETILSKVILR
jgi:hypothetical protein